ncbi:PROKR2 [Branchiostoma lanceolatum]|uniref:PROKR2 protein n=2 Tax=Branchiostoma lanceolatum TaxID=7740 RepID=A0A8J9YZR9_BRALA|nr:PROKR2 [Branchiostoma lanceolatum]
MTYGNETALDYYDGYDGTYDYFVPANMTMSPHNQLQVIEELRFKLLVSRVVLGIVYGSILFVCTVGNLLLLVVMYRFKKARTRANRLLVNLVLSDLLTSLLCVTFNIDYYVVRGEDWVFGAPMCAVVNYVKTVSLYVSTNTLVTMAVDRCIAVTSGLRTENCRMSLTVSITLVWIVSALLAIPDAIFSDTVQFHAADVDMLALPSTLPAANVSTPYSDKVKTYCRRIWSIDQRLAYRANYLFLFVAEFAIPVAIMTVCSTLVARKVWDRKFPGNVNPWQLRAQKRSRRKTVLLLLLVASFCLCLGPFYVYALIRDFFGHLLHSESTNTMIFYIVEAVAMANCLIDTLAYVAVDNRMRRYIGKLLVCFSCCQSKKNGTVPVDAETRTARSSTYGHAPIEMRVRTGKPEARL